MDSTREDMRSGSAPAQEPGGQEPSVATPEVLHLLLFRLGRELFAIALGAVEEAVELSAVERVPDMPDAMLGVCDVRGTLVPVYSPAGVLRSAPAAAGPDEGVMLLVRLGARRVAVAVDDVEDVLSLEADSLRQPALPDTTDGVVLGIARVGRELAAVIDPAALLAACGAAPSGDRTTADTDASVSTPEAA